MNHALYSTPADAKQFAALLVEKANIPSTLRPATSAQEVEAPCASGTGT
jgi:hypothetical protein